MNLPSLFLSSTLKINRNMLKSPVGAKIITPIKFDVSRGESAKTGTKKNTKVIHNGKYKVRKNSGKNSLPAMEFSLKLVKIRGVEKSLKYLF